MLKRGAAIFFPRNKKEPIPYWGARESIDLGIHLVWPQQMRNYFYLRFECTKSSLYDFLELLALGEKEFVGGPDYHFLPRPEVYDYVLSKAVHFIRKAKEWNLTDQEAGWADE